MNRVEKIKKQKQELLVEMGKAYLAQKKIDPGIKVEIESMRSHLYLKRESKRSSADLASLATERIILGADETRDTPPNESAAKFGIPVARLIEIGYDSEPKGFASGFLVAPNILITNNHVFTQFSEAVNCAANFGYQKNILTREIQKDTSYILQPEIFFYTCKELDFSLVFVSEISMDKNSSLANYGHLSLISTRGKVKRNSPINIVHYPGGGLKKYTTEQNFVTDIDDEKGYIFYTTDTQKGSSGSPCSNISWEVVALHSTAVPRVNARGQWLTKDGEIVDIENTDESEIDWIANAGISISKIIDHLRKAAFNEDGKAYVNKILSLSIDPLETNTGQSNQLQKKQTEKVNIMKSEDSSSNIAMNFYGNTNVYLNYSGETASSTSGVIQETNLSTLQEKKEVFDEDYSTRKGYNESFIKGFNVPMPTVHKDKEKDLFKLFGTKSAYIIPYHHYSLVMNKTRRMCMWTAVNADYRFEVRDSRTRTQLGNGAWRYDPRIPVKYQIGAEEFYDPATLVDKGHIVRRDDNCWWNVEIDGGIKTLGIDHANADTFHWSNCTPQHEAFNRDTAQYAGVGLWGILENGIKEQLDQGDDLDKDYSQRACVLAGPILKDSDPEYNGIQYPLAFWKVFAIRSKSKGNLVYGFILSQEDKVDEFGLEKEGLPRWSAKVQALRRSLTDIEMESGMLFHTSLHEVDTMKGKNDITPFGGKI